MIRKPFFLTLLFLFSFTGFIWAQSPLKLNNIDEPDIFKTIRVGAFTDETVFFLQSNNEEKNGYGYEYLYTVGKYTNWHYEFVSGSWADLYQKLIKGEIDLLCDVNKSDSRIDKMLFPDQPMGTETYFIFVSPENTHIKENDFGTLNNTKIGVNSGSSQIDIFNNWCDFYHINAQLIQYTDPHKCTEDVINGILDGYLNVDMLPEANLIPTITIGESYYYIAVNKDRPDILEDLNNAQNTLNEINPAFFEKIFAKYFKKNITRSVLSAAEKEWLRQKGSVTMGCVDNTMPFSDYTSDGEFQGVVTSLAKYLKNYLGIPVRLMVFPTPDKMKAALRRGDIDIAFPNYNDPSVSTEEHLVLSEVLFSDRLLVVYKDTFSEDKVKIIATYKDSFSQKYILKKYFPDVQLKEYDTREKYLNAILRNQADCCIGCGSIIQYYMNLNAKYSRLSFTYMDILEEVVLLTGHQNHVLSVILDKAIVSMENNAVSNMVINEMTLAKDYSFFSFLQNNLLTVVFLVLAFFLTVFGLILFAFHIQRKNQKKLSLALSEAQKANAAKTEFLSRISHDIRTPINGILGMLQITEKNKNNPEKLHDCHQKIEVSANHLLSLINDVLDMSSLETGRFVLEEIPFDLFSLIGTVKTIISPLEEKSGIKVQNRSSDILPHRYLIGSPLHLRQILVNLISNSLKYGKEGGHVICSAKEISNDNEVALLEFTIEDDGIGMSQEFQEHMFEAFRQENPGAGSVYKGSGLGLAIVHRIVEQMGGKIKVESIRGEGTTFTVQIPFQINHQFQEETKVEKPCVTGIKILLVEDNELNMEIAQFMLDDANIKYDTACNGREALEIIKNNPAGTFDLILMDIMMPVLDGYETTRAIRSLHDRQKNSIPIIAMTANAFEEDKKRAIAEGMNGHIAKPVKMEKLLETISEVVLRD